MVHVEGPMRTGPSNGVDMGSYVELCQCRDICRAMSDWSLSRLVVSIRRIQTKNDDMRAAGGWCRYGVCVKCWRYGDLGHILIKPPSHCGLNMRASVK